MKKIWSAGCIFLLLSFGALKASSSQKYASAKDVKSVVEQATSKNLVGKTLNGDSSPHITDKQGTPTPSPTTTPTGEQTPPPTTTPTTTPTPSPTPSTTPSPLTSKFKDVNDSTPQAQEIDEATSVGLVSGLPDGLFHPNDAVTREQMVAIVTNILRKTNGITVNIPAKVTTKPFPDVPTSRWSAPAIAFAASKGIVKGYKQSSGSYRFKLTNPVTRAEEIAMLHSTALYIQGLRGKANTLPFNTPTAFNFTDIQNSWAQDYIKDMSRLCNTAYPVQPTSDKFAPNQNAIRASAATSAYRTWSCLNPPTPSS